MNPKLSTTLKFGAPALLTLAALIISPQTQAFTMENGDYIIQNGSVDFAKPTSTPTPTPITKAPNPGIFYGENYKVTSDPLSKKKNYPLQFSVSDIAINFGDITPGEPVTRSTNLLINSNLPQGYQIMAVENHELRNASNQNIPDTTCDAGNCTILTAAPWDNPLTYGLGYRCNNISGQICLPDFQSNISYKPLPNSEKDQSPQIIASNSRETTEAITEQILKVNISQGQEKGLYQNIIRYIAVPKL